jgi:DNA modification methylase
VTSVLILRSDARAMPLRDESVDCIVTSPPYWGLRDYGDERQIGLEASPAEYVSGLLAVFREARRVLTPSGTLWLNLGDCYARTAGKVGERIENCCTVKESSGGCGRFHRSAPSSRKTS